MRSLTLYCLPIEYSGSKGNDLVYHVSRVPCACVRVQSSVLRPRWHTVATACAPPPVQRWILQAAATASQHAPSRCVLYATPMKRLPQRHSLARGKARRDRYETSSSG